MLHNQSTYSALLVQVLWLRNRRGDPQLVDDPDALKLARKLPALNSRSHLPSNQKL